MKHVTPVQIRFKDTDKMGHVNNANHFTYLELARVKYFNDVISEKIDWYKTGLILAKIIIDYKEPLFLEDAVIVRTTTSRMGNKSFDLTHKIIRIVDGKELVAAEGLSVVVCFNYEENKTIAVPQEWVEKVKKFEEAGLDVRS